MTNFRALYCGKLFLILTSTACYILVGIFLPYSSNVTRETGIHKINVWTAITAFVYLPHPTVYRGGFFLDFAEPVLSKLAACAWNQMKQPTH